MHAFGPSTSKRKYIFISKLLKIVILHTLFFFLIFKIYKQLKKIFLKVLEFFFFYSLETKNEIHANVRNINSILALKH